MLYISHPMVHIRTFSRAKFSRLEVDLQKNFNILRLKHLLLKLMVHFARAKIINIEGVGHLCSLIN